MVGTQKGSMSTTFALTIFALVSQILGDVIVELPNGKIQGITGQTRTGQIYNSFLGVRYGKNPTDELRLQPSQLVEPWEGTFDATVEKGMCYQVTSDYDMETEDCLLLNLYTPVADLENNGSAGLPVMVFIHGGGFVEGTGILEWGVGPQFFMEYGVIMVSINYRVGPFGYMSTGDDVIPGNLGSKDQILALKWVQQNVRYFGGDPDKVTLFGQSAGAASISYLLLSPLAEGLFRGVILESGAALDPWAYQRDQVEITYQTAALIDSRFETNRNSTELLSFLQSVPAKDLDDASYTISKRLEVPGNIQLSQGFYYTPVVEHEHENAFLTNLQYGAYETGNFIKVPVLMGVNAEESMFMLSRNLSTELQTYDENPRLLVPFDMHVEDETLLLEIGDNIKEFYSPNSDLADNLLAGVQYHSNQDFDKGIIKQASLQSQHTDVYFYYFTYRGVMGNNQYSLDGSGGVQHGEETNYIFNKWLSSEYPDNTDFTKFSESDILVHYRFMSLFTNFAKELNPTPVQEEILQNIIVPKVEPDNFQYLEIGEDLSIHEGTTPKSEMYNFWNQLYETYAQKPYDTY